MALIQIDGARLIKDMNSVLGPIPAAVLKEQDYAEMEFVRKLQSMMVAKVAAASNIPASTFRASSAWSPKPVPRGRWRSHPRIKAEPREAWIGTNPIWAGYLGRIKIFKKRRMVRIGRREFPDVFFDEKGRFKGVLGPASMVEVAGADKAVAGLQDEAAGEYQRILMRRLSRALMRGRVK